ncbi:MAG TPA: carbohydrate-binding protein [Chitinispirillaceae bacterium]|jgi:glucuronoarabinoxylan endo-1,4-beta-xylanase|nr:carbohydrate-binding protein [Chitinispirillaceae bacterium]
MQTISFTMKSSLVLILLTVFSLTAQQATIDLNSVKQEIDGFGAASTIWYPPLTDAQINVAFGTDNNQMGLSILRIHIDPNKSWDSEKSNAQKAKAKGAKILATPWTPPASMKTNNNTVGGELKPESYTEYANYLNEFIDYVGVVDVISIQNEPNIKVDYESCDWTPTQLLNFCKNNASVLKKPVLMPETYNFDVSYSDPALNDPVAAANIDYIGVHLYGAQMKTYTNAISKGKKIWMTEHFYDPDDMNTLITFGKEILDCMYNSMNAYIYWYLATPNCNFIENDASVKKKGWIMTQFSRFVRPGYYRVDATYQPQNGVFVVAFKGENTVIVAVNQNTSQKSQTFTFKNAELSRVYKYTTSNSKNVANEGVIEVTDNSFTTVLDAQSVTTFVSDSVTVKPPEPVSAFTQIEAESYFSQSGIQIESCIEGGENVAYIENGDYTVYSIDFGTGVNSFQVRAASGGPGGTIELRLDSLNGPHAGTCQIAANNDWQAWTTITCNISEITGIHNLYLLFTGGEGYLFNINWFKFDLVTKSIRTRQSLPFTGGSEPAAIYQLNGRKLLQTEHIRDVKVPHGTYILKNGEASKTITKSKK